MENEQKLNRRQLFRNVVADIRLFAEGSTAIYVAFLREEKEKRIAEESKRPSILRDPINGGLIVAGLITTAVSVTRRLPDGSRISI